MQCWHLKGVNLNGLCFFTSFKGRIEGGAGLGSKVQIILWYLKLGGKDQSDWIAVLLSLKQPNRFKAALISVLKSKSLNPLYVNQLIILVIDGGFPYCCWYSKSLGAIWAANTNCHVLIALDVIGSSGGLTWLLLMAIPKYKVRIF